MATKTVAVQIRTGKSLEEVKAATRETFRILGGIIRTMPYGFDMDGGKAGVNFSFTATIKAAVSITEQGPGLFQISSVIVWSPTSLVWICLATGWFVFGLLWIISALYLFVDPVPVYYRTMTQVENVLNATAYPGKKGPELLPVQDVSVTLKKLQEMRDGGLITLDEYNAKKAEIIANM